jgi:hypothetical protein
MVMGEKRRSGAPLIVIILVAFEEKPQKFGDVYQENTGHKSIGSKKIDLAFPWKFGVLVNEEINHQQNTQRSVKSVKQALDVLWLIEDF